MKQMRLAFVLAAITIGISAAYANKKTKSICEAEQQYYYLSGVGYVEVVDGGYYCSTSTTSYCTYYMTSANPITYTVCDLGIYKTQ